jgi:hypothetical protein
MFRDPLIAAIRTGTAAVVALVCAWLVTLGVELAPETEGQMVAALVPLLTAVYNWGVIVLERRNPAFGYLLSVPRTPAYATAGPVPATQTLDDPNYQWHLVEEPGDYGPDHV